MRSAPSLPATRIPPPRLAVVPGVRVASRDSPLDAQRASLADDPDPRRPVVDAPRDRRRRERGALKPLVGVDRRRPEGRELPRVREKPAEEESERLGTGDLSEPTLAREDIRFSRRVPE